MGLWLLTFAASKAVWTGGLTLVALLVHRYVRKPAVTHFAWLAVLVSLFAPALITVRLPVLPADSSSAAPDAVVEATTPQTTPGTEAATGPSTIASTGTPTERQSGGDPRPFPAEQAGRDVTEAPAQVPLSIQVATWLAQPGAVGWMMIVWGAGTVAWLAVTLIPLARFRGQVRQLAEYDDAASHRARALGAEWGLVAVPPVYRVPGCVSPLICGVGRDTRILFPTELWEKLNDAGRDSLLLHELAHYRRCDHWVRLLEYIACGLFWWHPAVWLARHYLEQAEEQCCDAWVAERFEGPARPYAEALLAAVDYVSNPQPVLPPLSSGIGDVPFLKLRLTQIMQRTVEKSLPAPVRHHIAIAAGIAVLAQPVFQLTTATAAPTTLASIPVENIVPARPASTVPTSPQEVAAPTSRPPAVSLPAGDDSWWQAGPPHVWAELTSPDGRYRLTAASGFAVRLTSLDAQRGEEAAINLAGEEITCAQFFSRGDRFVAGSRDGRLRLWDAGSGLAISLVGSHRGDVRSVALTPDEKFLVSAGGDGVVMLWDVETGALEAEWTAEASAKTQVGQVRISPDGRLVAIPLGQWSDPESVQVAILDLPLLTTDRVFQPAGAVAVVEFSNNGRELLTIEWNGQAKYWSRETGSIVATGAIKKDRVAEATFSPATRLWSEVTRRRIRAVTPVVTRDPFDQ